MGNKYMFDNELDKYVADDTLNRYMLDDILDEQCCELTEADFYFSSDDRAWQSHIEDIEGGDNFADYCEEFFSILEEEGYYN